MSRIAVIGGGSWGTVLGDLLARKGHVVTIWAYEPEVVEALNQRHENPVYLPGRPVAGALRATGNAAQAAAEAEFVVLAPPSHVFRQVFTAVAPGLGRKSVVVSATKGFEPVSLKLLSDVVQELAPATSIAILSGPSFADEVYARRPTALVAASREASCAAAVRAAFATAELRVYEHQDIVGVQLGGALKNVIAVAAGMLDALDLGANARAALITRGLAEMARLGQAMGAETQTFAGLTGMGDLVLTTTGAQSRNRALGVAVAQGQTLDGWRAEHRSVAEGAETSRSAVALGRRHGVELPICEQVYRILFEGQDPRQAVTELMERTPKAEGGS